MPAASQPGCFKFKWFDNDGAPAAGWTVATYQAGTSTPLATYTDAGGGTSNGTSFVLNDRGEANVWLNKLYSYKFVIKDLDLATQDTIDNIAPLLLKTDVIVKYGDGDTVLDSNDHNLIGFGVVSNAVNYLKFSNAGLSDAPSIKATGSATNINVMYYIKGSGRHILVDAAGNELFTTQATASNPVNNWSVGNAATGANPTLLVEGDDTNISGDIKAKGTGIISLKDGNGNEVLQTAAGVASAVNQIQITNAATGNTPQIAPAGDDTNIGLKLTTKGTGSIVAQGTTIGLYDTNTKLVAQTQAGVASAVNYLGLTNAATGTNPIISSLGTDTNIGLNIQPKGTGTVTVLGTATGVGTLQLSEQTGNGTNVTGFAAPTSLAADLVYTLPSADGSANQVLKTNGSKTLSWTTNVSGVLVQRVNYAQTGSFTGTTTVPADDTIPQNTEGTAILGPLSITPQSAVNNLRIVANVNISHSSASAKTMTIALFQDSTANALAAACSGNDSGLSATGGGVCNIRLEYVMTAGTTSATQFSIRGGANIAGTMTVNGSSGSRLFGGVLISNLTIEEYTT